MFFEKALNKAKASGQQFSFDIYLGRSRLGHLIKTNSTTFQSDNPGICSILVIYNRSLRLFSVWFLQKKFFKYIVFISYSVHDVINFEILFKPFSYIAYKVRTKAKIS